jgi:hypothetical protein
MPVSEACEATLLSTIFGTGDLTPILGGASPEAASWTVGDDHPLRDEVGTDRLAGGASADHLVLASGDGDASSEEA